MRSLLKATAGRVVKLGLLPLVWRRNRKNNIVWVLMYHGISDIGIPQEMFAGHVAFFSRHFESFWASELPQLLRGDIVPTRPPIVMTFDDGLKNNSEIAAPILAGAGMKGTFYVISGLLGGRKMLWNHDVLCRLQRCDVNLPEVPQLPTDAHKRAEHIAEFIAELRSIPDARRAALVNKIIDATPDFEPTKKMLANYELMSIADIHGLPNNIEIGSHTSTHRILTNLDAEESREELVESKSSLQSILGREVNSLCYPNGDYSDEIRMEAGVHYSNAVTVRPPGIADSSSNFWAIPRIPAYGEVEDMLLRMTKLGL